MEPEDDGGALSHFLSLLMRRHLPIEVVEGIVDDVTAEPRAQKPHFIDDYAFELAERLIENRAGGCRVRVEDGGDRAIAFIKHARERLGIGLREAKEIWDRGFPQVVEAPNSDRALLLVKDVKALGGRASIHPVGIDAMRRALGG